MRITSWRAPSFIILVLIAIAGCHASRSMRPVVPAPTLVVTDLVVGSGPPAQNGDTLITNYRAWLGDGTPLDSTYGRQPFWFPLGAGSVIRGWDVGMVGARSGGTRRLDIPSEMGYGGSGYPPIIPPNSRLVFDVELLELRPPARP